MTTCLTSLGDGIAAGMQMLAMALAQNQPPTPQSAGPVHPYPVPQTQSLNYLGNYRNYAPQCNQQFVGISNTRNQTTLPNTGGVVRAANQALYDMEGNDNISNYTS